ncbi:DNA/RNA helicase [Halobacillus halophilus]|uniref:ComF operon protein 1 n=1 Tax=Halobacillus halophilus (strain ATCC 35676 / DSM 2266 / JCM 20832 / KCTC 3685 / LMG 17431 / NBRC 102448 / NCIMB 2269) TaxID=866895 RepID=I0JQL0_HALH3|nr:helicase-related protein [Halobacillus halophilus]ASF40440.1 DNA/RNA helicase [Halobacillus halophilus]CCG46430.1 ComF operon protein 1 [Halobacillus halophilus DSM 2266]
MLQTLRTYFSADFDWIPDLVTPHYYPQLAGKLLLHYEIPLDEPHLISALSQNVLIKVPGLEHHFWGFRCRRCGNKEQHLFAEIPHAACGKACVYCRCCIQMGRVMECEPLYFGSPNVAWPRFGDPCAWKGELTFSQQKAADEIRNVIQLGKGEKLIWAVCGAGKTEMLFPGLTDAFSSGKRVCLATPRTDVVRELLPRLKAAFPNVEMEALYGDSPNKKGAAQFLIATTHQLLRFAHAFDVMIIDEIDAFPFHQDPALHYASKRAAKTESSLIYLTATPRKAQHKRIRNKTLPVVFIPKRFHGHPLPVPQLKLTPSLFHHLKRGKIPPSLLEKIKQQQQSHRQLLIFMPSVKQADQIAEYLRKWKMIVESVHAEDPKRADKVMAFRKKDYPILVTTTILERGVTFPSVDVYVVDAGHSVFDEAALVQIAGRAGRSPDDPNGEVIFFHTGKTNPLLDARESIMKMNRLGEKL